MTGLPFPMYRPLSYRQYTDSIGSVDKYWGALKKNIKNSLLAMPVLRTCRWRCGMSDFKLRA